MKGAKIHTVGIIMNGVTGRMGSNQHLMRSIVPLIRQGGVKVSDEERIVPDPILVGRNAAKLERLSTVSGIKKWTTDLDGALSDPHNVVYFDAQATSLRYTAVRKAIEAGKHVYCEKPLARDLKEARQIYETAKGSDRFHQMVFEYRYIPAIMRAKQLVEDGFLGRVFTFRGCYLHSGYIDPKRPISWRLTKQMSGGGALYDIGSHILDLVRFLLGEFDSVFALTETFIKERPLAERPEQTAQVDVDDWTLLAIRMRNGATGSVEASRVATGMNDELRLEIHGSLGAIRFNLMEPNWLEVYDVRDPEEPIGGMRGFKKIETVQRYPKPVVFPSPKFAIGWTRYHIASQYEFLRRLAEGEPSSPDFSDGLAIQEVMEAGYLSAQRGSWVKLPLNLEE